MLNLEIKKMKKKTRKGRIKHLHRYLCRGLTSLG